jgi:hypothetical protein
MKKYFLPYFILILINLSSCITELTDFEQIDKNSFLVVEAALSNQKDPHKVFLSTSSPNIKLDIENKPIINAKVYITDDKNGREDLTETVEGTYETSKNFKGIIGYIYVLNIVLPNGRKYQSSPEKLNAAPLIDNVTDKFVVKPNFPLTDGRSVGFDVTVDFTDPPEPNQYYQWKWTHHQRSVYCATCSLGYDYDLNRCSLVPNYEADQTGPETINFKCNRTCFDISYSPTYIIFSDNLVNGQKVTNFPIVRVPYDKRGIYFLKLEQRAISKKIYEYYRSIKQVTQNSGTLFDTPAETQFSPNIFSLNDSNERILGVFEVFGSNERFVYVDRSIGTDDYLPVLEPIFGRQLPNQSEPTDPPRPRAACIEGKYRTRTQPEGYRD